MQESTEINFASVENTRKEIIATACRDRNIALILSLPFDFDEPTYLDMLQSGIASTSKTLSMPKELLDLIKAKYSTKDELEVAFKKWKTICSIKYMEKALECATPIFDNEPATVTSNDERHLFVFKDQYFPKGSKKVFICRADDLKSQENGFIMYHGVALKVGSDVCILAGHVDEDFEHKFENATNFTVFRQPDTREFETEMQSLRIFKDDRIVQQKLFLNGDERIEPCRSLPLAIDARLNQGQQNAIRYAVGGDPAHISIINGSPGSGKTRTILYMIEYLKRAKLGTILVVTATNTAADVINERLLQNGILESHEIARIMASTRKLERVSDSIKSTCFTCYDQNLEIERFCIPKKNQILKKKVIIATIGMASRIDLPKNYFNFIIVDEAPQATEVDTGIVFEKFCGRLCKIILSGDFRQIGKINVTKVLAQYDEDISLSTMMRLANSEIYKAHPELMVTLCETYRSHKDIKDSYSKTMYDDTLISVEQPEHQSLCYSSILDYQAVPIRFHNCNGKQSMNDDESYFNETEAQLVKTYVCAALEAGLEYFDIGVVTPYRGQVRVIRDLLEKEEIFNIKISSATGFQADERRLIICSFVRTSGIGFLRDSRRPNTMISRAQHMLIMIGNVRNLIKDPYFEKLLRLMKEKNAIF